MSHPITKQITESMTDSMRRAAGIVADNMRPHVPVRTGRLRSSITHLVRPPKYPTKRFSIAGPDRNRGHHVVYHFGFRARQAGRVPAAKDFVKIAADKSRGAVKREVEKGLNEAIKRINRKA